MIRFRIGLVLLLGLLVLSFRVQDITASTEAPIAAALDAAADDAMEENWASAREAISIAQTRWQHSRSITSVLADHQPMEDIEALFAQLSACAEAEDPGTCASLCRELSRRILAMADAHRLSWQNFL